MKKMKNDNKGFTLVELIVVLVILAILAAILVPALLGYIDDAKNKQIEIHGKAVYTAAQSVASKNYAKNLLPTSDADDSSTGYKGYATKVKELAEMSSFGSSCSATIYFEAASGQGAYKVIGIKYTEGTVSRYMQAGESEWSDTAPSGLSATGVTTVDIS